MFLLFFAEKKDKVIGTLSLRSRGAKGTVPFGSGSGGERDCPLRSLFSAKKKDKVSGTLSFSPEGSRRGD